MHNSAVRYSEGFKIKVVREVESGRFRSFDSASRFYGIKGKCTIGKWIRKYGDLSNQRKVIRVETQDEHDEIEHLKARIADLERAIADSKIETCVHKAYFDIVCREFGVKDKEALKKSFDKKLSRELFPRDHRQKP